MPSLATRMAYTQYVQDQEIDTIDHGGIGGLTDDDHAQYPLLAGRSGGQTIYGGTGAGDDITIESTLHGTKGDVNLGTFGRFASSGDFQMGGANTVIDVNRFHQMRAYTVGTLPAAGTPGRRAYVTDATAPTFLATLVGGGAVVCPAFDDGTNWVAA